MYVIRVVIINDKLGSVQRVFFTLEDTCLRKAEIQSSVAIADIPVCSETRKHRQIIL